MYGWTGRLLDISLSNEAATYIDTPFLHDYIGGRGLGARLFYERASHSINPFSPECPLIFSFGPLTGTISPTSGRFSAVSKSPLTNTIFDANCGGFFAGKAKACGIDAVCLIGSCQSPSVLVIDENGVTFDNAKMLWGCDIPATATKLKAKYGKGIGILAIGPAGENKVLFSTISTDGFRVFGRGGLGAVMGAKNVKAIVVKGKRRTTVADKEQLKFVCDQSRKLLEANPITSIGLKMFGTAILVNIINTMGIFPNYNYQYSQTDKADMVSGETITNTILKKRKACLACSIQCDRTTDANGVISRGPEYESLWALGPDCGIFDLNHIARSNKLCNELGLDTITCGSTIACSMELCERGCLSEGIRFGEKGMHDIIRKIAYRDGFGDLLANGSKRLAEAAGRPELAMQVKGLEMPAYDPRGAQGMGLAYAVSNRGACHLRSYILASEILGIPKLLDRALTKEKVSLEVVLENTNAAVDSLALCRFTSFSLSEEYYSRMLSSVTGVEYSENDFIKVGERIWNLERLFNNKAGFTHEDDTLPSRLTSEPISSGPAKGQVCRLDEMLQDYYKSRGWDGKGQPLQYKLKELGLENV